MTEKEAIKCFEKTHFLHEQNDMKRDIDIICCVLSQNPIDMVKVREKIGIVNCKHPENIVIYNLIFPPKGNPIFLNNACDDNLISDLIWKLNYLKAKREGKSFEEFCKTIRDMAMGNLEEDQSDGQNENGIF